MGYILVIWTVIAAGTSGGAPGSIGHHTYRDWRYLGEFKNETACLHAAHTIGLRGSDRFRCLPVDTHAKVQQ